MKRITELRKLSEHHHHGLVLARKAIRAASGGNEAEVKRTWDHVLKKFEMDLEPHFRIEEEYITPVLERKGEQDFARRLLSEHEQLRTFVSDEAQHNANALNRFGILLERHIRFEEREVFETVQRVFTHDELNAIIEASGST